MTTLDPTILYCSILFDENDDWPVPIPDNWIYGGTADEFGLIERWMVPVESCKQEIWMSDPQGTFQVLDKNGTEVDTVTDLPGRKVYVSGETGDTPSVT